MVMVKPEEIDLVIVHGHCPDGFGAAYAAWRLLGDKAEYLHLSHGEAVPDVTGRVVGIFDFAFPRAVMEEMKEKAKDLILIDHHASAERFLGDLDYCHFDMTRSGCVLAWEYFHPGVSPPSLLLYIEDRDIWKWELEGAADYLAYVDSMPHELEVWDTMSRTFPPDICELGSHINRFKDVMIQDAVDRGAPSRFFGVNMMVVNCASRFLVSKVCNLLASEQFGVALAWWYDVETNESACSLRSTEESGIDVSEIASAFGGGGHVHASGFKVRGLLTEHLSEPL